MELLQILMPVIFGLIGVVLGFILVRYLDRR